VGVVCVGGWLYNGPASGGVKSDRLVLFDAVRIRLVGPFELVMSVDLCSTKVCVVCVYIYIYI
jgi:hypothetical protein